MLKSRPVPFIPSGALVCAAALLLTAAAAVRAPHAASAAASPAAPAARPTRRQTERVDIRMRSFAPPASGHVTIEASGDGGRGRVTVLSLADPQTITPGARAYVVWAVSEGRIARLGEINRDERGNGGLAFERPAGFERYGVVVTAEATPDAVRPGAPVLSTRAGEATALYPPAAADNSAPATPTPRPSNTQPSTTQPATATTADPRPASPARPPARPRAPHGRDFYTEVDDALATSGGGRLVELEGAHSASSSARGTAHTTTYAGNAYVRASFRGVPLPSALGANVYVLWAIVPDDRIIYMGSLPSAEDLNRAEIYVRTAGFGEDTFELFVTAERARPAPAPSPLKVLTPRRTSFTVR